MASEKEREALGDRPEEKIALRDDEEKPGDKSFEEEPELDSSKVKFINGGTAADAHVDIEGKTHLDEGFQGLTKEELMQYANDPYWVKVRWILFILFWVAWVAMLVAAILIIVFAPRCPPRPKLDWWQKSVAYQIYPRSYKDAVGDNGIGDLKGIKEKLPYIRDELNATAILLGSIYPSPNKDTGYDVTNFQNIDSIFGNLDDFRDLRIAAHKKGIKIILDFIPNHSSEHHSWFSKSQSKDGKYADYYVWHDGKSIGAGGVPNNWLSVYGGSAWQWDVTRGQYYLHQYRTEQPDLNLRNEDVLEELDNVLRFWLDQKVDGFRIDAAANLVEAESMEDEPASGEGAQMDYEFLEHTMTTFQPETYDLVTRWRSVLDSYSSDETKILIVEAYGTANQTMPFYEYNDKPGAQLPLNFNLVNLKKGCDGWCVEELVDNWMSAMDSKAWANWVLGNHDHSRVATRLGQEFVNAANMLAATLPGTMFTYYGEEIGMHDVDVAFEDGKDPLGMDMGSGQYKNYTRDPERTPMQWSDEVNAGFSEADTTWLPVASDFSSRNVAAQKATGAGVSNLNVYSHLTLIRREPSFQWGTMQYALVNDEIFSFVRQAKGFDAYLVAMNVGDRATTVSFHASNPELVSARGKVMVNTANFPNADFAPGNEVSLDHIHLRPAEGLVVKLLA